MRFTLFYEYGQFQAVMSHALQSHCMIQMEHLNLVNVVHISV